MQNYVMNEFEQYDKAIAAQFARQKPMKAPLSFWDCLDEAEARRIAMYDVYAVLAFGERHGWVIERNVESLITPDHVMVVTNPQVRIVHATRNMTRMNGYLPEEIIGASPKIFQGPGTDANTSARIRQAISDRRPFEETVINYYKDGRTYDCHIKAFPMFNSKGELMHFIAFETAA
jgi:PAS domain S-box-containing protein